MYWIVIGYGLAVVTLTQTQINGLNSGSNGVYREVFVVLNLRNQYCLRNTSAMRTIGSETLIKNELKSCVFCVMYPKAFNCV